MVLKIDSSNASVGVSAMRASHLVFFFNDTATTEIYTLSLHDALPISRIRSCRIRRRPSCRKGPLQRRRDRKSTRLNSSHSQISYAVFCLKKKKHATRRSLFRNKKKNTQS